MFAPERYNAIKRLVRKHRRMAFAELQRLIKVSPATLRRDLGELEKAGELIRVHGGILDPHYARSEISFDERMTRNRLAKRAMAHAAAALIPAGARVFMDAGSTCLEAAKALLSRKDLCIITHSVALMEAALDGEAEVLCLGGSLRRVSGALTGGSALRALELLRIDWAFLGASGLDPAEGCMTTELSEAEIKRAVILRSARHVLLADFSKWKSISTVRFAEWSAFDYWIVDRPPPRAETQALRAAGVKIIPGAT